MVELDLAIAEKIGNAIADDALDDALNGLVYPEIPDDVFLPDEERDHEPVDNDADAVPEADYYSPEVFDEYLTAEVLLPTMGNIAKAKATGRKQDSDGNPIGKRNANPMLDTCEYKVAFPDGATDVFTANIIAENLHSQVDEEGNKRLRRR
jgi:hypothetical protein